MSMMPWAANAATTIHGEPRNPHTAAVMKTTAIKPSNTSALARPPIAANST
jgi:hypothetical protein